MKQIITVDASGSLHLGRRYENLRSRLPKLVQAVIARQPAGIPVVVCCYSFYQHVNVTDMMDVDLVWGLIGRSRGGTASLGEVMQEVINCYGQGVSLCVFHVGDEDQPENRPGRPDYYAKRPGDAIVPITIPS